MPDLLIALKVDPGTALTTLDHATAKFKEAEQRGNDAAKSMLGVSGAFKSLGQAIQQEQAALGRLNAMHEQLARQSQPLAQGFGRIAEQLAREKSVLEQIRAPQMEYFDTLTALDKLLERNAISTAEYAQQVTRLNQSIEQTPAPKAPTVTGGLGALGGALVGGGAAAGVLAFGHQIEQVGEEYEHLDDTYTNLYNHALKFADAGHNTNSVLAQQGELATTLHTTLAQTMDIYDGVGDALNDMNLSSAQLARITQTVGEAAQLAGKPLATTGDLLNQMVTAMNSGADAGRSLRTIMVQVPELAQLWEKSFHTDEAGLMSLAKQGKLTATDLVNALMTTTRGIDELHAKLKITHEDEKQIFDEKVALYRRDSSDFVAVFEAANPKLREFNKEMQAWGGTLDDDTQMTQFLTDAVRDFGRQLDDLKNKTAIGATNTIAGFFGGVVSVAKGVNGTIANYDTLAKHLGIIDPWKVATDAANKLTDAHVGLTHALSDEDKMLQRLHGPADQAYKDIATAEVLYAKGAISLGEYNDELARNRDLLGTPVPSALEPHLSSQTPELYEQQTRQWEVAFEHRKSVIDKYARLSMENSTGPTQNLAYGGKFELPAPNFNEFDPNKTSEIAAQMAAMPADATKQLAEKSKTPWQQFVAEATDSAGQIKTALSGAFSTIEDELVSMVTKGKFDLSSLASSLEQIAVRFAVQQATGGLLGLIGGGMTGFDYMTPGGGGRYALPGFATGGDMLVGGAGAPDSKLAMFRVSPGESIHVRTPQQREAAMQGGAGGTTIVNAFNFDQKAFRSKIVSDLMNSVRNNPAAFRALLGL